MHIRLSLIALLIAGLAACTEEGTYPLTGEECSPEDPVLQMEPDCPGLGGTGSF